MKQALLVIDYINGIATTGTCAEYLAKDPSVIQNTNLLIQTFRDKYLPIFFVRLAFDTSYIGMPAYLPTAETIKTHQKFLISHDDTCFIDTLNFNADTDRVFNKKAGDPFCGNQLMETLKEDAIDTVVFTGIATDNAILYGANTAMTHGFKVIIVHDACAAATQAQHEYALSLMQGRSSNDIATTHAIIGQLYTELLRF